MRAVRPADAKAESNRVHARWRAYQRYGVDLGDVEIAGIESAILAGRDSVRLLRPDLGYKDRWVYAVDLPGPGWVPVVFDGATGSVVTFLPPKALEYFRHTLGPAPAPPPPRVPDAGAHVVPGPFVPRVVGFIPVPEPFYQGPPELPPVPAWSLAGGNVAEARESALTRLSVCESWLRGASKKNPNRAEVVAESDRLKSLVKTLRFLEEGLSEEQESVP